MNNRAASAEAEKMEDVVSPVKRDHASADDVNKIAQGALLTDLDIDQIVLSGLEPSDETARRFQKIIAAKNPLLEAARPLLLTLAQLRHQNFTDEGQIEVFHQLLAHEVTTFTQLCYRANIPREHIIAASYAMCSALDEGINHTNWGGGKKGENGESSGVWFSKSLASHFHHDVAGGTKLFLLIGRLVSKSSEHLHLLEIMYRVLALGMQGMYRTQENGRRDVDAIRAHLYSVLSAASDPVPLALSPNWKGEAPDKLGLLRSVPIWVTVSVLGLGAFGLFSWYKYQLLTRSNALATEIVELAKQTPAAPAVRPAAPPLRLAQLLQDEINAGQVKVEEDNQHSEVIFKGDDMFVPGQAHVTAKMMPLLEKVAAEIAKVSGPVQVVGHTDNVPIKTKKFPDNQMLSEERAASVADVLEARGVSASRLEISGKGDSEPVVGNATPAQRAQNRRVEIIVLQPGGKAAKTTIAAPTGSASTISTPSSAAAASTVSANTAR